MKKEKIKQEYNEKKKQDERYIQKLEAHIEKTNANLKYSIDRFDILIISISSGGLVFSMGYVKDILSKNIQNDFTLLKISWIFFGTSIILNLLSQVTSYYANKYEISISRNLIRQERDKPMTGNQPKFECRKRLFDFLTNLFNLISLLLLISAIIILIVFVYNSF